MERYIRHIQLDEIGQAGQQKLAKANVLVIGAGGLGCPVLQYLVAAGVGTIGIVDFDRVEISNLQRQVLFGTKDVGKNKALAAQERLQDLNPDTAIIAYPVRLTTENALDLFQAYDLIVDATDRIPTRYLINDAAVLSNKPVIYGAIYKFEGQVAVFNYKSGPTYRDLFPTPPSEDSVANCNDIGVLGVLPGIIGTLQANEVLKCILGYGECLSDSLLCYNAKSNNTSILRIPKRENRLLERLESEGLQPKRYDEICETEVPTLDIEEALAISSAIFVDVRNPEEQPNIQGPNILQVPLASIEKEKSLFKNSGTYICFCASGVRSRVAVQKLQQYYPHKFYNLKDGATTLAHHLKQRI